MRKKVFSIALTLALLVLLVGCSSPAIIPEPSTEQLTPIGEPIPEEASSYMGEPEEPEKPIIEESVVEEPNNSKETFISGVTFPELGSSKPFNFHSGQLVYEDTGDRGYSNLQNPTYQELLDFLAKDKTEEIPYVDYVIEDLPLKADGSTAGTYVVEGFICQDFATLLQENANNTGWRAAVLFLNWYPDRSHAINAFETTDKGLIWVSSTGNKLKGHFGSDSLYEPCYDREDLYPIMWGDNSEPAPCAHPMKRLVYIW